MRQFSSGPSARFPLDCQANLTVAVGVDLAGLARRGDIGHPDAIRSTRQQKDCKLGGIQESKAAGKVVAAILFHPVTECVYLYKFIMVFFKMKILIMINITGERAGKEMQYT